MIRRDIKRLLTKWTILVFLLPLTTIVEAEITFRSKEVKRLVEALHIDVDSLHEGINSLEVRQREVKLVLSQGQVTFVGYHLFPDEMKAIARTPILNFLERYFLQLDYPTADRPSARKVREERFKFEIGSLQSVATLCGDEGFSYGFENKRYTATWTRDGQPILSVSFPAEHELISGENKIEAENHVEADILGSPIDGIPPVNEALLSSTVQKDFFVKKGSTYMRDLLVSDLYYQRCDSTLTLVMDKEHPLESAANLMMSPETEGDYTLNVRQVMYGYKKKQFDVPLRNWIAYCLKSGCDLYFGAESFDEKEVKATVIAVNVAENYNHVLFVDIPLTVIETGGGDIKASLETFIPMHNVQNLFAKYKLVKNKQPKIFE